MYTEEVDRLRDSEGEFGELKGRVVERKRQCDDCAVHDAVGQYECHTFSPRSILGTIVECSLAGSYPHSLNHHLDNATTSP